MVHSLDDIAESRDAAFTTSRLRSLPNFPSLMNHRLHSAFDVWLGNKLHTIFDTDLSAAAPREFKHLLARIEKDADAAPNTDAELVARDTKPKGAFGRR